MPNTRRRKFSVQHDIVARNAPKMQDVAQSSRAEPDSELRLMAQNLVKFKANKKNKVYQESSISEILEIVSEIESTSSMMSPKTVPSSTMDKDVTANSSNIDLFNLMNTAEQIIDTPVGQKKSKKHNKQVNCEVTPQRGDRVKAFRDTTPRRDKPRQHRVKVRSPKRRVTAVEEPKNEDENKQTTGTNAIDWDQEIEVFITHVTDATKNNEENRASTHSIEDMCRICHGGDALSPELGQLISACSCRGTVGRVHVKCLERWLTESGKSRCELCGTRYATRRVHRYGVPRALVMWILSQNAKQLMVDSLGIMLMSPLAILAAWLSGRTLAGLTTQDSHVTPWPLASTFVLACMTLVCYYCWIVSAATRHALGWWIWYRSQYEVRLQYGNDE